MEATNTQEPIVEQVKRYLETKIKLLKYQGVDKASDIIAEVITDLIMVILLLLTFLFFSVTLALFIGHLLHSAWEGFGCVTGLYIIIVLAAKTFKVSIQNMFIRIFIRKIFKRKNQ